MTRGKGSKAAVGSVLGPSSGAAEVVKKIVHAGQSLSTSFLVIHNCTLFTAQSSHCRRIKMHCSVHGIDNNAHTLTARCTLPMTERHKTTTGIVGRVRLCPRRWRDTELPLVALFRITTPKSQPTPNLGESSVPEPGIVTTHESNIHAITATVPCTRAREGKCPNIVNGQT